MVQGGNSRKKRRVTNAFRLLVCLGQFDVLRRCPADPKAIKAAVKELGHGTYTIITGRLSQVVFSKVESDRIVM